MKDKRAKIGMVVACCFFCGVAAFVGANSNGAASLSPHDLRSLVGGCSIPDPSDCLIVTNANPCPSVGGNPCPKGSCANPGGLCPDGNVASHCDDGTPAKTCFAGGGWIGWPCVMLDPHICLNCFCTCDELTNVCYGWTGDVCGPNEPKCGSVTNCKY
jgi:hypothetical protein